MNFKPELNPDTFMTDENFEELDNEIDKIMDQLNSQESFKD